MLTECKGTWLHSSGVVPIRPDRSVPDSVEEQAEVVWANITAILDEAQMVPADIVSITTYVVVDFLSSLPWVMQVRDRALHGRRVASTLVTVPALANPAWKLEIAIIAAR
ncbi:MAG: RidA family protein [Actinobacteria bacterium]|nr:RidA family protein [Actinomycetota bacterium]